MTKKQLKIEERRTRFHHMYANLPLGIRDKIICVIDDEPYTYQVVRLEVNQGTKLGDRMLEFMDRLEVL